jgi:hypothetical protein
MFRKLLLLAFLLSFSIISPSHAATIIWVSGGHDYNTDGVSDDYMWVELLEAEGYTVDYQTGNWTTLDDSKIEALNSADLVIIARCTNSGDYATDATELDQWDSITTPMINNSTHLMRSSRWRWLDTTGTASAIPMMRVIDTGHPILSGVALDADNQVEMIVDAASSFPSITDPGNGTVIATRADNDEIWIATWEPGVEYYPGSGQMSAGPRMFMAAGTQEAAGGPNWGELNLTDDGIQIFLNAIMFMLGEEQKTAHGPEPKDGSIYMDTWTTLTWSPGASAVSHDLYFGDVFEDVNNGAADTFLGNLTDTFTIIGFSGYPYSDPLVPGTTYYWRVDEVNEADPNSPWKGDVWSFSIPSKTAYAPEPALGAELVPLNATLSWTAGFDAKLHIVYFGEDFDTVNNATDGQMQGNTTYNPGRLKLAKTYYWRVDEFDAAEIHKGDVWSFTTLGAVGGPNPADGAEGVSTTPVLTWNAGAVAASHEVYFGTDADAVSNATKASPEYKGSKALGDESYDPGRLMLGTTYYWRIEEVNGVNPDSPWAGNIWSFTTGDFLVLDDFETYDANDNQIWYAWHDGLGYGMQGIPPFFAGNGTGAAIGDETTDSYTEETIVHGGLQSMPLFYDNNKQGYANYSEAEYTLSNIRDWTAEGIAELSIWFRGNPPSVGSFVEGPTGTYTITASGVDIWSTSDEFHYAFKTLTGAGSITAKVESLENTNGFAKAGLMVRNTLDPDSTNTALLLTPANGVRFQYRPSAGSDTDREFVLDLVAPLWLKLERDVSGNFRGYYSSDGINFQALDLRPYVPMSSNVYVGLALTSHDAALTCQAVFSNVTINGNVSTQQWASQDIGITSNDAELLYVAVSNSAGAPAVIYHDDPDAATIDTWTEWVIPLSAFADQGINLADVDRIAIGLGTRGNTTVPGGSGKMYFDDIRLYRSR